MHTEKTNKKTIWIILKGSISHLPPVMSLLESLLLKDEYEICFISSEKSNLVKTRVNFREFICPCNDAKNIFSKLKQYLKFRKFATEILLREANSNDILWCASMDTVISLWNSFIFEKYSFIVQLHELYDAYPIRLKLIKSIAQKAKRVVVPEINRAAILQVWLSLKKIPSVVPNKPFFHPRKKFLPPTTELTRNIIKELNKEKKIIIYQGHISADRNLMPIASAMKSLKDFDLLIMGKDHGFVSEIIKVSDNIKYLGHLNSPLHLEITSYADIGILSYDAVSLNNVFCAPNKLWEYAGFGVVILSNELVTISEIANKWNCGLVSNFTSEDLIEKIKI